MEAARDSTDALGGARHYDIAFDCDGRWLSYTFEVPFGFCDGDENKEDTVKEINVDVGRQFMDLAEAARVLSERLDALTKRVLDGEAARAELREVLRGRGIVVAAGAPAAAAAPAPDGNGVTAPPVVGPSKAVASFDYANAERVSGFLAALKNGPRSTSAIARALDLEDADAEKVVAALLAEGRIERVRIPFHGWGWASRGWVKTKKATPKPKSTSAPKRTAKVAKKAPPATGLQARALARLNGLVYPVESEVAIARALNARRRDVVRALQQLAKAGVVKRAPGAPRKQEGARWLPMPPSA